MDLIYKDESYRILGACFEVYKEMGCGFAEAVYQECLEIEFALQELSFKAQTQLSLTYKSHPLTCKYEPDFIVFDKIALEIKSAKELANEHRAQVHNYLKATGFRLGLLVNFGHFPKVEYERNRYLIFLRSVPFRVFRVFRG